MATFSDYCEACLSDKKRSIAVKLCSSCDKKLCLSCILKHRSLKKTEDHVFFDITVVSDPPAVAQKRPCCINHSDRQVAYFCTAHDEICCELCVTGFHKSCDQVMLIELACQNVKASTLEDTDEEIQHVQKILSTMAKTMDEHTLNINDENDTIKRRIAEKKAKLIKKLDEEENRLISELGKKKDLAIKTISDQKKTIESVSDVVATSKKQIDFVTGHGTNEEAFLFSHDLKSTLKQVEQAVTHITANSKLTNLTFKENEHFKSSFPNIGCISMLEYQNPVEYAPIAQKYAQCFVPRLDRPINNLNLHTHFKTTSKVNILGMMVTESDNVLLCNFSKQNNILIYSKNGKHEKSITMKHEPWDIADLPTTDYYVVTLPWIRSIQYINKKNLEADRVVRLSSLDYTYGIAASKQNIFVGGSEKMFISNFAGEILKEVKLGFGCISYLTLSGDFLYASDDYSNIFHVEQSGKIIKSIPAGTGNYVGKIAVDQKGCIFIGGQDNGRIMKISKDMENKTTAIEAHYSSTCEAICFNKDCTKLYAAGDRGKTIVVYNCL